MNRDSDNRITAFAQTNFRNHRKTFGIKRADRRSGMYVIGKTGTGKSTLMETMIRQDIENGEGVALLDPHGDLVEKIARNIPEHPQKDLIRKFMLPFLTAYDPLGGSSGSMDPLGALQTYSFACGCSVAGCNAITTFREP